MKISCGALGMAHHFGDPKLLVEITMRQKLWCGVCVLATILVYVLLAVAVFFTTLRVLAA